MESSTKSKRNRTWIRCACTCFFTRVSQTVHSFDLVPEGGLLFYNFLSKTSESMCITEVILVNANAPGLERGSHHALLAGPCDACHELLQTGGRNTQRFGNTQVCEHELSDPVDMSQLIDVPHGP